MRAHRAARLRPHGLTLAPRARRRPAPHGPSWAALERRADRVRDWNGTGLDPRIRPLVVALWAHGLETDFSCQGHLLPGPGEATWSFSEPMVSVAQPQPEGTPPWEHVLDDDPTKGRYPEAARRRWEAWATKNLRLQRRLLDLLARFYGGRDVDPDVRLQLDRDLHWGRCTLRCAAGDVARLLPAAKQRTALRRFQAELAAFAAFLRDGS